MDVAGADPVPVQRQLLSQAEMRTVRSTEHLRVGQSQEFRASGRGRYDGLGHGVVFGQRKGGLSPSSLNRLWDSWEPKAGAPTH